MQLADRNEEIQETVAPTREDSLTTTYSRPIRHSQYAEYEYLTEEGEVKSITGSSMMDWTSAAIARRRRAMMEEGTRQRDADSETHSRRVNNLSFREKISVRPYEQPNARSFKTPDTKLTSNVLYYQQ